MGIQVNFYIDNKLQQEFIKYIYECGCKIMDCISAGNKLNIYDSFDNVVFIGRPLYICNPSDLDNIFIKPWGQIDPLDSHIIEFIPTSINSLDMEMGQGRIWFEKYVYINEERKIKNQLLLDLYNSLCKWIKKNTDYVFIGQKKQYVTDRIIELVNQGYVLR